MPTSFAKIFTDKADEMVERGVPASVLRDLSEKYEREYLAAEQMRNELPWWRVVAKDRLAGHMEVLNSAFLHLTIAAIEADFRDARASSSEGDQSG